VASECMRLHVTRAMAVKTELVAIIRHPQETAVGIEMLVVAPDTGQLPTGPASQVVGRHLPLNRRQGTGGRICIRTIPAVRCLVHPGNTDRRMVAERVGRIRQGKRLAAGGGIAGAMAVQTDIVVTGTAEGKMRCMTGNAY